MDKKAKKRIQVLRKKQEKVQQQIKGAQQQEDEPGELAKLEAELESILVEIKKLKES